MSIEIGPARAPDLPLLNLALRALSDDLGDTHRASAGALAGACFGDRAFASAILAREGGAPAGVVLYTPTFSTSLGGAGVAVSDLWVAEAQRGTGLGRRLLVEAARAGAARWDAIYLKLSVYGTSPGARAFYEHLGFAIREGERNALLTGATFQILATETA